MTPAELISLAEREARSTIQQVFIRVCRDSGFKLDTHRACSLAASVLGKHPLEVWAAMPGLDVMNEIAAGTHPTTLRALASETGK